MADGLLPYLFSRSAAFRRNLMDMVSNPVDYAAKMGGQVVDYGNEIADLQQRAGMFGAGPVDEAARDELYQRAADAAMNMTGMIRMSHGSPHKFTKFDSSKIGTGEGAQAYGHGLYMAEGFNSPVAIGYKGTTSQFKYQTPEGIKNAAGFIDELVRKAGDVPKAMQSSVRMKANEMVRDIILGKSPADVVSDIRSSKYARSYAGLADALESMGAKKAEGHLYNVEAKWPDAAREAADPLGPQHFLDWDKPLSEQSNKTQQGIYNALTKSGMSASQANDLINRKSGADVYRALIDSAGRNMADRNGLWALVENDPNRLMMRPADLGTKVLRAERIPGIRYLDGNSRAAGQGTSNYVIFPGNESLLEIIQRIGAP